MLQPCNSSLNTQIPAQAHPHPRLTGPWRGASVGRQELLVQCPRTHHRSIPLYAIRVAETHLLTGFSALPTLSTTMPPPDSHYRNTQARTHVVHSTGSQWKRTGARMGQRSGDGTVKTAPQSPFTSCWETLQPASLTVALVLSARPPSLSLTGGLSLTAKSFALHSSSRV